SWVRRLFLSPPGKRQYGAAGAAGEWPDRTWAMAAKCSSKVAEAGSLPLECSEVEAAPLEADARAPAGESRDMDSTILLEETIVNPGTTRRNVCRRRRRCPARPRHRCPFPPLECPVMDTESHRSHAAPPPKAFGNWGRQREAAKGRRIRRCPPRSRP
ncbi:unnamed protein product, partial [Prorocentrum cordatum]